MEKKEEDFLIENQDLIGAINSALSRGQTLKGAMMALYNAGYEKEKIEEAARAYIELSRNPGKTNVQQKVIAKKIEKKQKKEEKSVKLTKRERKKGILGKTLGSSIKVTSEGGVGKKSEAKRISNYGVKERKLKQPKQRDNSNVITFLLVFILIFLFLVLGAVFLFKEELINFFNRLFS